jgi:hypothetical protein
MYINKLMMIDHVSNLLTNGLVEKITILYCTFSVTIIFLFQSRFKNGKERQPGNSSSKELSLGPFHFAFHLRSFTT